MARTVNPYTYLCYKGHEYEIQCTCVFTAAMGPDCCNACMDAEQDCPVCYPREPYSPKKRWWLFGAEW